MKNVFLFVSACLLAATLAFCQNTSTNPGTATTEWPSLRTDSLFGIKGCDRAGFRTISSKEREFTYQHVVITVKDDGAAGGETIEVAPQDTFAKKFAVMDEGPLFFRGVVRNHLLVEAGTGPDVRDLIIYNMGRPAKVFQTTFCGDIEVTANGNVRFLSPTEEQDVSKIPECPEKEEWLKKDLKVGYGQVCLFSLVNRSLTRKSEYKCLPMQ